MTRTNYLGSVWCLRAFLPALEAAAPADVANVVSVAGTVAAGSAGPYTASKHAQLAFSRAVTGELRPRGIRVHTILPGFVETAGFPQRERFGRRLGTLVAEPELVAERLLARGRAGPARGLRAQLVPDRAARAGARARPRGAGGSAWNPPGR